MTKLTGLPEQTAQPRRAIGLRRRWIVSSILPVITILVLIAALVSIALGSNYYANASSALEAKATASTEYFNTYAMTSYDEYYRSATPVSYTHLDVYKRQGSILSTSNRYP